MSDRRRVAWLAGGVGLAAALVARRLRRRSPEGAVDDPAADLRRKLEESRALTAERDEFESGETTVDRAEPAGESVEERRRQVHDRGRAAVDEMRDEAE